MDKQKQQAGCITVHTTQPKKKNFLEPPFWLNIRCQTSLAHTGNQSIMINLINYEQSSAVLPDGDL